AFPLLRGTLPAAGRAVPRRGRPAGHGARSPHDGPDVEPGRDPLRRVPPLPRVAGGTRGRGGRAGNASLGDPAQPPVPRVNRSPSSGTVAFQPRVSVIRSRMASAATGSPWVTKTSRGAFSNFRIQSMISE